MFAPTGKSRRSDNSHENFIVSVWMLLVLMPHWLSAQIIRPETHELKGAQPSFNKQFIRQNKIKEIHCDIQEKADGEIIRDKGLQKTFRFDTLGNLVQFNYNEVQGLFKKEYPIDEASSKKKKSKVTPLRTKTEYLYAYDSTSIYYTYNSTGYLIAKRHGLGDVYRTQYFEYYGDGLVSRITTCKETNAAAPGKPFELGVQTVLADEKMEYETLSDKQIKKIFLNDEGKPYKQGIIYLEKNKIVNENYKFLTGFVRSDFLFTYDKIGNLITRVESGNAGIAYSLKTLFYYSEAKNVEKTEMYQNEIKTEETQYLYDSEKKFLLSTLTRNLPQATIKITHFEYIFY